MSDMERKDETEVEGHALSAEETDEQPEDAEDEFEAHIKSNIRMD